MFASLGALAKSARAAGLTANTAEKYAAETIHVLEGKECTSKCEMKQYNQHDKSNLYFV